MGSTTQILEQEKYDWTELDEGYAYSEVGSVYAGIKQRWIIIRSEQAHKREFNDLPTKAGRLSAT